MNVIQELEREQAERIVQKRRIADFAPGDTVVVSVRIKEGERSRIQAYEGVVIARSGSGLNESFTVRKMSYGEGVERVFPLYSPLVEGVKVLKRGKVRRAKLYYLRGRTGKRARIAEKQRTIVAEPQVQARTPGQQTPDVTLIVGIDPALAERLAGEGVSSLAQVAQWSADDVSDYDAKLALEGKIGREDWVGQAKDLLAGKPPRERAKAVGASE